MLLQQTDYAIGYSPKNPTIIGILKRDTSRGYGGIYGLVQNLGSTASTFSISTSPDNTTYTAQSFRVLGAEITSLSLPPGGQSEFFFDWPFSANNYVQFIQGTYDVGHLSLAYAIDYVDIRTTTGTP